MTCVIAELDAEVIGIAYRLWGCRPRRALASLRSASSVVPCRMQSFVIIPRSAPSCRRKTKAIMDKPGHASYLRAMLGRVIAFLAILSFAVVTAMTAAHTARATVDDAVVAAHASHMMAKPDAGNSACGKKSGSGASDAGKCATACASLVSYIAPTQGAAFETHFNTTQVRPADTATPGHSPGLNDQPPKTRLL